MAVIALLFLVLSISASYFFLNKEDFPKNIEGNVLGETYVSYTNLNNETYFKVGYIPSGSGASWGLRENPNFFYTNNAHTDTPDYMAISSNPNNYKWTTVIKEPVLSNGIVQAVLSNAIKIPESKKVLFIFTLNEGENHKDVAYILNQSLVGTSLKELFTSTEALLIGKLSSDGRYVSIVNLSCIFCFDWEMKPLKTLLLDTKTSAVRDIGKTYNFSWLENGQFIYQSYGNLTENCQNILPGNSKECDKEFEIQPKLSGKF